MHEKRKRVVNMNMKLREQKEIVAQAHVLLEKHMFAGQVLMDLLVVVDFENAKEFLVDDATAEDWKTNKYTREYVLEEMKDYLSFAYEKADNQRGLSAVRSLLHFDCWLFLLGEDDAKAASIREGLFDGDDYGIESLDEIRAAFFPDMERP